MISFRYKKNWRALLLALPLLMGCLTGQATNHRFSIYEMNQDRQILSDGETVVFSYTTVGGIGRLACQKGLTFYIGPDDGNENSLTLTSVESFSGTLRSIEINGNLDGGVIVEAYISGESLKYLGQLTIPKINTNTTNNNFNTDTDTNNYPIDNNQNIDFDDINNNAILLCPVLSGLSNVLQKQQILLKFSLQKGADNGGGVYNMTSVKITLDDTAAPLPLGEAVTFDGEELETADLTNYTYKGILFTLNTDIDGEGIDFLDGNAVCFMTPLTDAKVTEVNDNVKVAYYHPGDLAYAYNFSGGITMMVAKGSGKIVLDVETDDNYAFHVKIGNAEPVELSSLSRQELNVPYTVEEDTYVYIYLVEKTSAAQAGTRIGRRGTAYGKIYYAKCASSVNIPGDVFGNGVVDWNDVKAIVDYIMGTPPVGFNMSMADVNGDEVINAADLVKVIQKVHENAIPE